MNNSGKKYERFRNGNEIFDSAIPIVLGICALLIRGPGLGNWCITIDEFYFSQPVMESQKVPRGQFLEKQGYFFTFPLTFHGPLR